MKNSLMPLSSLARGLEKKALKHGRLNVPLKRDSGSVLGAITGGTLTQSFQSDVAEEKQDQKSNGGVDK